MLMSTSTNEVYNLTYFKKWIDEAKNIGIPISPATLQCTGQPDKERGRMCSEKPNEFCERIVSSDGD